MLEARNERTTTLARNSTQPARLIQWNRSGLTFPGQLRRWGDFFGSAASAVPDRSEIGPYLGGGSSQGRGSYYRLAKARRALGVGRCLRQRRVCGADRSEIGPYPGGGMKPTQRRAAKDSSSRLGDTGTEVPNS